MWNVHKHDLLGKHKAPAGTPSIQTFATSTDGMPLIAKAPFDFFKQLLVKWIVSMHISLHVVENIYFRQILGFLSSQMACYLPKSHNTIKQWIMDAYNGKKKDIRGMLKRSKSSIHIFRLMDIR